MILEILSMYYFCVFVVYLVIGGGDFETYEENEYAHCERYYPQKDRWHIYENYGIQLISFTQLEYDRPDVSREKGMLSYLIQWKNLCGWRVSNGGKTDSVSRDDSFMSVGILILFSSAITKAVITWHFARWKRTIRILTNGRDWLIWPSNGIH